MKRFWMILVATASLAGAGCDSANYKVSSQGAPYEIVVVADHGVWDSAAGDSLRSVFYRQVPMISRQETCFDVLRVLPEGFKKLVTRHPNILTTNIKPVAEPVIEVGEDVYAAPQIVLSLTAPDAASMAAYVGAHGDEILEVLERAERQRDIAVAEKHSPKAVSELIRTKFGIGMNVGPGYTVRKEAENFLWLSYEMPISSQGIIIYEYPFSGTKDFELPALFARRNEFTGLVPGENPGSFMTTNTEYSELVYRTVNGRQWSELHGFWSVQGDFMGGPYTNFSTLDVAGQRVLAVDFYVYSPDPKLSQRNYIRQLEHFLYTVKF